MKITDLSVLDLRFPTSKDQVGTDAVHTDPDYSAAYVILETDGGLEGHGLTFTIGRGNEVCAAAIEAFRHLVVGRDLHDITSDFGGFWHSLAGESQLRWLGPEKGVIHLALAAVVNAVWDLYAKAEGKPVWKLLADMTPAQLVSCIDFHHITDALTPDEALAILERHAATKATREAELLKNGYPAYTTSVGWLGYSDEKIHRLCQEALADGWTHFKVKVGGKPEDDLRRLSAVRAAIGPDHKLMIDSNQRWDVDEAIARIKELSHLNLWWAEEPTHPDDVLGHARIAQGDCAGRRRDGRARREPRDVQAAAAGQRHQLLPDRQLPPRRRERKPRGDAHGGEVRRAGVPARRRRRACASTCSTSRCSTSSRSPARWKGA